MKAFLSSVFTVLAGILIVCSPVWAHHGASMFDMNHLISVKGTVTAFDWENPHVMIYADAASAQGNTQKWSIELRGGPHVLAKAGWSKDTIRVGDQITFVGHPNKKGLFNMRLQKVVFSNGMQLFPKNP
ncbi:MAG TPA: DUF6152 family protein [Candidatus Dormibacteraeota bacterium]|nr:DUF6152 family protein [Candidatus Dormibacteraeota bacterium]